MTPADVAVTRRLVKHARAAGWRHGMWGVRYHEHLYCQPGRLHDAHRIIVGGGVAYYVGEGWVLEHKAPGECMPSSRLTPTSAAEVEVWLRLLGLLPTVEQVAKAALTPDAVGVAT